MIGIFITKGWLSKWNKQIYQIDSVWWCTFLSVFLLLSTCPYLLPPLCLFHLCLPVVFYLSYASMLYRILCQNLFLFCLNIYLSVYISLCLFNRHRVASSFFRNVKVANQNHWFANPELSILQNWATNCEVKAQSNRL